MNMQEIKNEAFENIVAIVLIGLCLIAGWLYYDSHKRTAVYEDTNIILDGVDQRIKNAGKRIDSATKSVDNAEKTITGVVGRVEKSQEFVGKITDGVGECENRLDAIIQRQGRISNIVTEVERLNRP